MKFEEALKLMREGKKFKGNWDTGEYFFIDKDGVFRFFNDADGQIYDGIEYLSNYNFSQYYDWQEYKEPILDDVETKYLEAVLRPFKKRIDYVIKRVCSGGEYIFIFVNVNRDSFSFPCFKPNTMYKGMELNKQYTLEELGLFEGE